jgi:hypothetical protein
MHIPVMTEVYCSAGNTKLIRNNCVYDLQWVLGTISPGVKRPGREADHSLPSSAKVKNGGAIPPLPPCLNDVLFD